jgi:pilus assembly protein Flp/PilA
VKNFLLKLWKDEEGAELVEWVIIVALIAVAAIATYTMLETSMSTKMTQVLNAIVVP